MRVTVREIRVKTDKLKQFLHALINLLAAGFAEGKHWVADDIADSHTRVEAGIGVLENHLQVFAHQAHRLGF